MPTGNREIARDALEIRPFASGDADALFELMKDWDKDYAFSRIVFDSSLASIMENDGNELIVAYRGNRLVGYAQTLVCRFLGFEPSVEVLQLLVAQDARSGGIGGLIMSFVEDRARKNGFRKMNLHSQVKRSRAHVFYEGLGYELTKISKFYEKSLGED